MANKKISELSSAGTLTGSELLEIVKNSANYKTTSLEVANLSKTYTVYTAKVSQSGTDAPTATVIENTTDETFTFDYLSQGTYKVTKSGSTFDETKTVVFHSGYSAYWFGVAVVDGYDNIPFITSPYNDNTIVQDDLLNGVIEIRIYN